MSDDCRDNGDDYVVAYKQSGSKTLEPFWCTVQSEADAYEHFIRYCCDTDFDARVVYVKHWKDVPADAFPDEDYLECDFADE